MSDIIRLLPDSIANQIAAGEVIQRPASVVKELVENSVDAGATKIKVVIKDAGRTLVQVVDNGKGMSPMDARMSFERHATSKIADASDLFALRTMGFRGEALASIAAVAQVEVSTMRKEDSEGIKIYISGSKFEGQEMIAAVPGTNMMVKNLFFNVPARRKFLKKDAVELNNIVKEFERLALVNPTVEMTLIHNDVTLHQLLRGNLKQRIGSLFGKGMERQMIPVETETSIVKIDGFVGLPENSRRRGALQYLFVNGRNMRHPYFHKAIMKCYENLIRPDEQPNYFMNFTVDPSTIDVNIHPTKNEIKFENEQPIWQILVAAIKEALGKFNIASAIDFDSADAPEIPAFDPKSNVVPDFGSAPSYNPFSDEVTKPSRTSSASNWQRESRQALDNWETLYESFNADSRPSALNSIGESAMDSLDLDKTEVTRSMIQVSHKYIATQGNGSLIVIDQRRAHIKILYERILSIRPDEAFPSQGVMFPENIKLPIGLSEVLRENLEMLVNMGFELSFIGDGRWAINGIPAIDFKSEPTDLLKQIVEEIADETDIPADMLRCKVALQIARAGAMTPMKPLSDTEMQHLVSQLYSLRDPAIGPDGLKIISELKSDTLEKLF